MVTEGNSAQVPGAWAGVAFGRLALALLRWVKQLEHVLEVNYVDSINGRQKGGQEQAG